VKTIWQLPDRAALDALDVSQRAAVAANYLVHVSLPDNERARALYASDPDERAIRRMEEGKPRRGPPPINGGGGALVAASLSLGVPRSMVGKAYTIMRRDPKLFAELEAGHVTLWVAYEKVKGKRPPKLLTQSQIGFTLEFLRNEIEARGEKQSGIRRRCPSDRWLRRERRFAPELSIALFKELYPRMRDAYDEGRLDAAIDAARYLL
jgi:hypothetical protein